MKLLKGMLLALLFLLLLSLAIGTALRWRAEKNAYYLGSAIAPDPLDVGDTRPTIFDTRHYEEQIRQAV